jgi:hypothetical protein
MKSKEINYYVILNGRKWCISINKDELRTDYRHLCTLYRDAGAIDVTPKLLRYVRYRIHMILFDNILISEL